MSGATRPPLVLLGGSYNAISAARRLGPQGVAVTLLSEGRSDPSLGRSRHLEACIDPGDEPHEDVWTRWLDEAPRPVVVMAGSDEGLEYLANHRQRLSDLGHLCVEGADEVVVDFLDKHRAAKIIEAAGVPAPRVCRVGSPEDLATAAESLTFPCAVKPVHSHEFAQRAADVTPAKGLTARDPAELERVYRDLAVHGAELLVTEFVPGPDAEYCSYYSYIDEDGAPLLHFTKRKPRQYPPTFGSGTYHTTEWLPDVAELGLRLFTAAGVRGIGNVEFKRDARDGQLKVIECNLRLTAADGLVQRAGVDLASLAYERAIGHRGQQPVPLSSAPRFRQGLSQWSPLRDARAFLRYRRRGELDTAAWLRTLTPPLSFPLWSMTDPLPSLANAWRLVHKVTGRLTGAARSRTRHLPGDAGGHPA
jgi:D-aspartate ligase